MPFKLTKSNADQMLEICSAWRDALKGRNFVKNPLYGRAYSIAEQMCATLESERHGYLWIAYDTKSNTPLAMMVGDDAGDKKMTLRFLLSDVKNPDAKGSGRFLVQQLVEWAGSKGVEIRTMSENADKFWKSCPGFAPAADNRGEYVFDPRKYALLAKIGFFDSIDKVDEKENASPHAGAASTSPRRG